MQLVCTPVVLSIDFKNFDLFLWLFSCPLNLKHMTAFKYNLFETSPLSKICRLMQCPPPPPCKYKCDLFHNDLEVFPFHFHHNSLIDFDPWVISSDQILQMATRN